MISEAQRERSTNCFASERKVGGGEKTNFELKLRNYELVVKTQIILILVLKFAFS